jgi:3-isopropylmalate dehydrogenase
MLLRYTAKNEAAASQIETAIEVALQQGYRTRDIAGTNGTAVSTSEMGSIIAKLAGNAAPSVSAAA